VPEAYFAREFVKHDDYSFLRADTHSIGGLQLETVKQLSEQNETALRMRYPQVSRRPEMVLLLTVSEIALLLGPFVIAFGGFWGHLPAAQAIAAVAVGLLIITHYLILLASTPGRALIALPLLPLAFMNDIYMGNASMAAYEFSDVDWKGRNICLPVLQAIPKLPKA